MSPDGRLALPGDRLRERALAVAVHAADAEDLAAADRERDVRRCRAGLVPAGGRVDKLEPRLVRQRPADVARRRLSSRSSAMLAAGSSCSPNMSPTIIRWSCVAAWTRRSTSGSSRADDPAGLEDDDPVADGRRLVELVGDEDDRRARLAFRPTRTFSSSAMPWGVSIDVGSSRMSTREPFQRALMISTCCCWPSARLPARASGSSWTPSVAGELREPRPRARPRRGRGPRFDPSMRFSSTDSVGMRDRCW